MLDPKTSELIAVAASVVAKCQPCLDYHVEEARKAGATDSDIRNAVSIARMVRAAGNDRMDEYTNDRLGAAQPEQASGGACCCSGPDCCQ